MSSCIVYSSSHTDYLHGQKPTLLGSILKNILCIREIVGSFQLLYTIFRNELLKLRRLEVKCLKPTLTKEERLHFFDQLLWIRNRINCCRNLNRDESNQREIVLSSARPHPPPPTTNTHHFLILDIFVALDKRPPPPPPTQQPPRGNVEADDRSQTLQYQRASQLALQLIAWDPINSW